MIDCTVVRTLATTYATTQFNFAPWVSGCLTSGLAVTTDNHVWVTSRTGTGYVIRFDANQLGATTASQIIIAVIGSVGSNPTGISIDNLGRPWATCLSSNEAIRINPASNTIDVDGSGNQIRVSIGAGASAYNYGDMTGSLVFESCFALIFCCC